MAEAKTALNLPSWVRKIDARCPRGHRSPLKLIKDHTQDRESFPFRLYKAWAMLLHCSEPTKTERPCRDQQTGRRDRNCHNCGPCGSRPQSSTPATGVNTTEALAENNGDCVCDRLMHWEDKDLSQTTCYNNNKKRHFANQCTKLHKPKNEYWSRQPPCWWLVLVRRL